MEVTVISNSIKSVSCVNLPSAARYRGFYLLKWNTHILFENKVTYNEQ